MTRQYLMRLIRQSILATCLASGLALSGATSAGAVGQTSNPVPALRTNQSYVEDVTRDGTMEIGNLPAVFKFVFASLPETVRVYPTENYYYFSFYHGGLKYAGNLRLDVSDRDKGIVHFAYFTAYNDWNRDLISRHKRLSDKDGVAVEKLEKLTYRITYGEKSVVFKLNDLSNVRPKPGLLHKDEVYIGPVFDESGIQFFLVFNRKIKLFHYILNDAAAFPDTLSPSQISTRIEVGNRTGFAYYRDKHIDRRLLIGVYDGNARVNNYFDGPFDQLPDNFIKGDLLKNALIAANPEIKGNIDRLGNSPDGEGRVLIGPYKYYSNETELAEFDQCASQPEISRNAYYACFNSAER